VYATFVITELIVQQWVKESWVSPVHNFLFLLVIPLVTEMLSFVTSFICSYNCSILNEY